MTAERVLLGLAVLLALASFIPTLRPGAAPAPVMADQAQGPDLSPILDFAPFGAPEAAADLSGLTLLGITLAESPEASRAIIAGGTEPLGNYGPGDALAPGVTLARVLADRVTLDLGGQAQDLTFPPDPQP